MYLLSFPYLLKSAQRSRLSLFAPFLITSILPKDIALAKKNKFSLQKGVVHLCFLVGLTSAQSNRLWFLCICSYHKLARRNQLSCSGISFYLKLAKAKAVLPLTQYVLEETPPQRKSDGCLPDPVDYCFSFSP